MSKIKNFMNKPITWGGYFKLSGICALVGAIISGASIALLNAYYDSNKPNFDGLNKKVHEAWDSDEDESI